MVDLDERRGGESCLALDCIAGHLATLSPGARIPFRTHAFQDLLERVVRDPVLAGRHPAWVVGLCKLGVALGVHRLTHLLGGRWTPPIETHVTKAATWAMHPPAYTSCASRSGARGAFAG